MKLPAILGCLLAFACAAVAAQTRYRVTDIGALIDPGGAAVPTRATGIDARGRVVGAGAPGTPGNGFLYAAGTVRELTLGYPHTVPGKMSPRGHATGDGLTDSSSVRQAFRLDGGALVPLGTGQNGFSRGADVNDGSVVVGYTAPNPSSTATTITRWTRAGIAESVPTLGGGFGRAFAVNNRGWIVGDSDTGVPLQGRHAFLHADGTTTDLGVLRTGDGSVAYGINEAGTVVGSSLITVFRDTGIHAFVWKRGRMRDLGTLGGLDSAARDVNAAGTIVGYSLVPVPGSTVEASHAFVHDGDAMRDLNDLLVADGTTYLVLDAAAINDAGQIAASGVVLLPDGSSTLSKALLLTPEPAVP